MDRLEVPVAAKLREISALCPRCSGKVLENDLALPPIGEIRTVDEAEESQAVLKAGRDDTDAAAKF
jgi:hypothetical protein